VNVLLLAPELYRIGGIQRYNRLLISALPRVLAARGGSLRVLALNDPQEKATTHGLAERDRVAIECCGGNRARFGRRVAQACAQADTVLYGSLGLSPLVMAQLLLYPAGRRLLILYGIEAWEKRSLWHALAVSRMDGYLAISRYTLQRFREAYGIRADKYAAIVPNVVSPGFLEDAAANPLGKTDGMEMLSVSRLDAHDTSKGVDDVIRCLPDLITDYPRLRYTVIGDGVDRARLEGISRDLCVQRNVLFRGFVSEDELREAYRRCALFVLPSAKEGFGFVYIEAMAYGKAVVAARATAVPEVVIDGGTGILVEHGNTRALAEALRKLLGDPQLRVRMGTAGRSRVADYFSYPTLMQCLERVLDSGSGATRAKS
jgi:glycosyltransferase involved in cell wall biosynthesis